MPWNSVERIQEQPWKACWDSQPEAPSCSLHEIRNDVLAGSLLYLLWVAFFYEMKSAWILFLPSYGLLLQCTVHNSSYPPTVWTGDHWCCALVPCGLWRSSLEWSQRSIKVSQCKIKATVSSLIHGLLQYPVPGALSCPWVGRASALIWLQERDVHIWITFCRSC